MDFRIPGLPHSVVKHAQSTSVRQLMQKIEKHPDYMLYKKIYDRINHSLFCPESKPMIRDVGNIELCELLETELNTQCKVCLTYWNSGILYYTCGHFLHQERGAEYVIKKDDLMDIDMVKKPGDKEYHTAKQLKKKCKKETVPWNPRPIHTRSRIPYSND